MIDPMMKSGSFRTGWTVKQRFNAKVGIADDQGFPPLPGVTGCTPWLGALHGKGYGHFRFRGHVLKAHRVAWELAGRDIPNGMQILHACDNPRCVNVEHLFLGTNGDNLADRQNKGRQARGESHSRAKLTSDDVILIRSIGGRLSMSEIGVYFGVTKATIRAILKRISWRHI